MSDSPLMGVLGSHDPSFDFGPNHIFGIGVVRQFKFRVLIDTEEF